MSERSEEFHRWPRWVEYIVFYVVWSFVGGFTILTYNRIKGQSAQWLLAYGAATYALAIVAALLIKIVVEPSWRLDLRWVLTSLLLALLAFPSFFGSVAIVQAFIQLTGNHVEGLDVVMWGGGGGLWFLVVFLVTLLTRRTARRV